MYTIERMQNLRPGETMQAYVGNFERDIARCDPWTYADKGAPTYKTALILLRAEMQQLIQHHRISVNTREHPDYKLTYFYDVQGLAA